MHTVGVVLVVIVTASWWLKRNIARSPAPNPSTHFHAAPGMDRPSADLARGAVPARWKPLILVQKPSDHDQPPSLRVENGAASGKNPQLAPDEIYSPIRRRFLELKGEAAAIVERHRTQQLQLNHELARDLSTIREQMEKLLHEANAKLETIDPKLPDLIRRARRHNRG